MEVCLDKKVAERILNEYPVLEIALQAGVVSLKMVRELMRIDRWLMKELYKELVIAGAVIGVSTSAFRATEQMLTFIKERCKEHEYPNSDSKTKIS